MSAHKNAFNNPALDPDKVQRTASDPAASVWLTANAGTGKTKVLTDRVLRLLLDGNAPEDILCVTFTTAAAALMQKRIRKELSIWAICSDADLDKNLKKLTGKKPDAAMRNHARQLFTRFLEAPEGIKIQTIHSLSQTLIQKFPIESGVPPSFKVMDDEDAYNILRDAQAEILNAAQDDPHSPLAKAVNLITPEVVEEQFISLVNDIVSHRKTFRRMINEHGDLDKTIDAVYQYLGARPGVAISEIKLMMGDDTSAGISGPDTDGLRTAAALLKNGSKTDQARGETLQLWLDASVEERALMFDEYCSIFLTESGDIRKTLATKQAEDARDILSEEAQRLTAVTEEIKTANVARGTEALMVLGDAVLGAYERRKKTVNYLDYDDLIDKAATLMRDETKADWALKKMPGDLKHILVDEAQDTSPEQWRIVSALMTGMLADKKNAKKKTLFVVGDEKQSIFSFQGADPTEFMNRKKFFEKLITDAGGHWRNVDMDITFRSTQGILDAVDAVFKGENADGIKGDESKDVSHKSFREGHGAVVEINPPLIGERSKGDIEPWSLPDTMEDLSDASLDLAEEIADRIQNWLETGEKLDSRGRAIIPSDIMILVRRRSQFIHYMVRALKRRDIPVAGVDRMILSEQIAVKDLLALGETLLHQGDDYKLAVVLKSPVIGMTEQQLLDLAIDRDGATLWDVLKTRAQSTAKKNEVYKKTYEYLNGLSEMLKTQSVLEFYYSVLLKPSPDSGKTGLASVYKRLGNEAEDPMVEFLNALERFEQDHPPSLQSFIHWLEAGEAEIKREISLDTNQPKINIMTVHGAKGLEAPIVILPDTTGIPNDNIAARPRLLWPTGERRVPLWAPTTAQENSVFQREKAIIENARDNEFKRLLYVAMTRAADRLYVYGYQNRENMRDLSWHKMISDGLLQNLNDKLDIEELDAESQRYKITYKTEQTAAPKSDGVKTRTRQKKTVLPDWARVAPKAGKPKHPNFTPSQAAEEQNHGNDNTVKFPSPLEKLDEKFDVFKRGTVTHNLLEFLPRIAPEKRQAMARRYLAQPAYGFSEKQQHEMYQQIDAVLKNRDYSFIFAPGSKAEVNILGLIKVQGQDHQLNGQIDRLVVRGDDVWIVDYKSNREIPASEKETKELYIAQMAAYKHVMQQIYPKKNIRCALLWTRRPKWQELSVASMDAAAKKLGLGQDASPKNTASKDSTPKKRAP